MKKESDNIYDFPKISDDKYEDKFQVLETSLVLSMKIEKYIINIIKCILYYSYLGLKMFFKTIIYSVSKIEKISYALVMGLVKFIDLSCCVIARKIHGC